jgi:hypothetical protein
VAVKSPVTKESLQMIKIGLGLVVSENSDDLEIVSQASFYAGAIALLEQYLNEGGSAMIAQIPVAEYAAEAALFAITQHREEEE